MSENYINKPSGTVAARCSKRHRHWRRVASRAADEGNNTGGSETSSSSLSPYAGGDLQNNQKHNRQLILIFLFVQVRSRVCCSVRVCCSFLLQTADLVVVEGVLEVGAVGVAAGERDSGGSVGTAVGLSCSRRLAGERWVSV